LLPSCCWLAVAGLACALLPRSSFQFHQDPVERLSPVFSGKWVPASPYIASPLFVVKFFVLPSGKVNFPLESDMNTTTVAGWLCITDFS